jgi:hypothetical protein
LVSAAQHFALAVVGVLVVVGFAVLLFVVLLFPLSAALAAALLLAPLFFFLFAPLFFALRSSVCLLGGQRVLSRWPWLQAAGLPAILAGVLPELPASVCCPGRFFAPHTQDIWARKGLCRA